MKFSYLEKYVSSRFNLWDTAVTIWELSYKLLTSKLSNYKENTLNYLNKNLRQKKTIPVIKEESKDPLIYIYNTHQTEEYETSTILDYSIKPTVTISNYILEEIFNKNKLYTYVEESNIKEIHLYDYFRTV